MKCGEQKFSLSEERFFLIDNLWVVVMQGNPLTEKTYNHIAFQIDECNFEAYKERIEDLGVEVREPRSRIDGEGRSLYFYDYDNHLFELHTGTLTERIKSYSVLLLEKELYPNKQEFTERSSHEISYKRMVRIMSEDGTSFWYEST